MTRPTADLASIGRYKILGLLGSGGMADVYVAARPEGGAVAIKLLHRELVDDAGARMRFLQEARIIHRVRHPNIIGISDVGQLLGGRLYLVLELLRGQTLAQRLAASRISPLLAIDIVRQVGAGLAAAHAAGVYHRDLKPDNIFLVGAASDPVRVKILDWGAAWTARDDSVRLTADGLVVGTPLYMAPEQACGRAADARTDVYALGTVAYEMFLESPPFASSNRVAVMYRHMCDPPPAPSSLWPGIPLVLESVLLGMLSKVPEERPALDVVDAALALAANEIWRRVARSATPVTHVR